MKKIHLLSMLLLTGVLVLKGASSSKNANNNELLKDIGEKKFVVGKDDKGQTVVDLVYENQLNDPDLGELDLSEFEGNMADSILEGINFVDDKKEDHNEKIEEE